MELTQMNLQEKKMHVLYCQLNIRIYTVHYILQWIMEYIECTT